MGVRSIVLDWREGKLEDKEPQKLHPPRHSLLCLALAVLSGFFMGSVDFGRDSPGKEAQAMVPLSRSHKVQGLSPCLLPSRTPGPWKFDASG